MRLAKLWQPPINLENSVIVADGNSQTAGTGVTPFTTPLGLSLGVAVSNFGVSGQTTQQMINDAVAQIDSLIEPEKTCVLVASEIRNEMVLAGAALNVNTAVDRFWAYCDARNAAGWKVVVWSILPNTHTSNASFSAVEMNAFFDQANARLANEWRHHAHGYVNVRADADLAVPSDANTYWQDGIHPTSAGYAKLAALIAPVVRRLRR